MYNSVSPLFTRSIRHVKFSIACSIYIFKFCGKSFAIKRAAYFVPCMYNFKNYNLFEIMHYIIFVFFSKIVEMEAPVDIQNIHIQISQKKEQSNLRESSDKHCK